MYRRHSGGPVPAGSRRYDPYRRHLAGLAWVPTRSRRSIRKEFRPAARSSPSQPSAEARYVVNRKIAPFPAGRKRFYNSGPIFPARRKRATRLAREDDKTSCPTPAAATVRPRAEVCSTDLSLRSAFRPPQPWRSSWHGHPGPDLIRGKMPVVSLGDLGFNFCVARTSVGRHFPSRVRFVIFNHLRRTIGQILGARLRNELRRALGVWRL